MLTCIENTVLSSMAFAPLCRVTSWTLRINGPGFWSSCKMLQDWQDRVEMMISYCTYPIQTFTRVWPMSSQPPLSLTLTASSEVRQGPWVIEANFLPFSRASNLSEFHHWHHQHSVWVDSSTNMNKPSPGIMRPLTFSNFLSQQFQATFEASHTSQAQDVTVLRLHMQWIPHPWEVLELFGHWHGVFYLTRVHSGTAHQRAHRRGQLGSLTPCWY